MAGSVNSSKPISMSNSRCCKSAKTHVKTCVTASNPRSHQAAGFSATIEFSGLVSFNPTAVCAFDCSHSCVQSSIIISPWV